jgi:hypothetical protein
MNPIFNLHDQASGIFILYLIIASNFLLPLFSCRMTEMIQNSMMLKHLLGYLTMTFFVILVNIKDPLNISQLIFFSLLLYGWFFLTTRSHHAVWVLLIGIFATVYLLDVFEDHIEDKTEKQENKKLLNWYKAIAFYLAVIVSGIGIILQLGSAKLEMGKKFSYMTFLTQEPVCLKKEYDNGWIEAMKAAFIK